jgi:peptide/nickel transport system substrate-binding protein
MFFAAIALVGLGILTVKLYLNLTIIKPDQGGSINVAIVGSPHFINPVLNQVNDADRDLSAVIFSGLLKYDGQGNLINELAEKYAIGDNGKIYDITLKKDILWHDKKPLTADDVIFTVQTIQNAEYRSPIRALWQGVEVEKIDDLGIRFKLKNSYAAFLNNLTFGILPKHLWENITASQFALNELNSKPIGCGPYKFKKFQKDAEGSVKSLEVEAFKNYFADEPFISSIVFKFYASEDEVYQAYKKGEADVFSLISAKNFQDLKNKNGGNLEFCRLTLPRYFAVFFNQTQNKFLADKNVRQVLAWATNKKEIIENVFSGYGQEINSPLAPGMTGFSEQVKIFDFDLEHAKNTLTAVGWKDIDGDGILETGKDNQKLEITITTIDWPELTQTAQILQKQWQQVGAKINLDIKDVSAIQNEVIKPRQYQALLFGEVLGQEPDLFSFWHSTQKKEFGLNLALYENTEVDKLLSGSREDLDKNSRAQKNQQAVNLIIEDLPAIFLFSPDYIFLAKKEIQGIDLKNIDIPSSRFSLMNQWYIKTRRAFK